MLCPNCSHENKETLHFCTRCGVRIKEKSDDLVVHQTDEQTEPSSPEATIAYSSPSIFKAKFIPAQIVRDKSKEVIIVEFEGTTIETNRTAKKGEARRLFIDGREVVIASGKQKTVLPLKTRKGEHTLAVWNDNIANFFFMSMLAKRGIAMTIDGIPVRHTLADPLLILKEGRVAIWVFVALLLFKTISPFFLYSVNPIQAIVTSVIYAVPMLILFFAAVAYRMNPFIALWIGIIIGGLETVDFLWGLFLVNPNMTFQLRPELKPQALLIWGSVRSGLLYAMIRSLRAVRKILQGVGS